MYNVCNRHPLVCVSRLMVALQLYIIQQRVSLVCAKFRICSFIVIMMDLGKKNISQKKAHGEAGALKLNFLDIILVTRLMKRNLIVDLSVVL